MVFFVDGLRPGTTYSPAIGAGITRGHNAFIRTSNLVVTVDASAS
jgi:hypothetical protein